MTPEGFLPHCKVETCSTGMHGRADSPGGSGDKDDGKDEPEHVAEDDHFHHVQVRPEHIQVTGQIGETG